MSLKEELKQALDSKDYAKAIDLIQRSNVPDKAQRIAALQERMKAEQAKSDEATLKTHIAGGNYGQARELLQRIDHPQKAMMLAELDRRIAGTSAPVADVSLNRTPEKRKAAPAGSSTKTLWYITLAVVGILAVAFIVWFIQNQRRSSMYAKLYTTCHDVFREDYYDGYYTAHQMVVGCMAVVDETIDLYGEEVNYCYDTSNQTDARFTQCLVDNDVKMYATALLNAPKE